MPERWERQLDRWATVKAPQTLQRRVNEGPHGDGMPPTPNRRQRLMAGTVALAVFAAAAVLVWSAFSDRSAGGALHPMPYDELRATLESEAGRLAKENGGTVPSIADVVLTTRQAAMNVEGGDIVDSDQPVYMVQMQGKFVVNTGPYPSGVEAPTGGVLFFLYDPETGGVLDWGVGDHPADLASLGEVWQITPTTPNQSSLSGYPSPPGSGYWIIFPDTTTPIANGMQVIAKTNLPDGTLYLASTDQSGECCPSVKDGEIVVRMNDVGQLESSSEASSCDSVHGIQTTPALVITITVDREIGRHVRVPVGTTSPPEQPDSVVAVLGNHFEQLSGDQVVTTDQGNELVARATYPWPEPQCAGSAA